MRRRIFLWPESWPEPLWLRFRFNPDEVPCLRPIPVEDLRTMKEHEDNRLSRRQFLLASALAGGGLMLPTSAVAQSSMQMPMASTPATPPIKSGPADVSLHIGSVLVDV